MDVTTGLPITASSSSMKPGWQARIAEQPMTSVCASSVSTAPAHIYFMGCASHSVFFFTPFGSLVRLAMQRACSGDAGGLRRHIAAALRTRRSLQEARDHHVLTLGLLVIPPLLGASLSPRGAS